MKGRNLLANVLDVDNEARAQGGMSTGAWSLCALTSKQRSPARRTCFSSARCRRGDVIELYRAAMLHLVHQDCSQHFTGIIAGLAQGSLLSGSLFVIVVGALGGARQR